MKTIGPFIREKIRRVLNKTRTFRINGTFHIIFPRINGPNMLVTLDFTGSEHKAPLNHSRLGSKKNSHTPLVAMPSQLL